MKIPNLMYNINYISSPQATVDWIAGGNFDGYIYKTILRFLEDSHTVIRTTVIVDKSRYDSEINTSEQTGTFSETEKSTITCTFQNFSLIPISLQKDTIKFALFLLYFRKNNPRSHCYADDFSVA